MSNLNGSATNQSVIENFGRNVAFRPQAIYAPQNEDEVLQILARHRGQQIRAIGRLHAWSEAAQTDEVLIDLRHLNTVQVEQRGSGCWASVGAGCQIKRVLAELERQASATLPSVGLITEQAIAGAISTGTHGSGKHSLSHYIAEVRLARYDSETGQPVIQTVRDGPELQAARCSLGCLGIILAVGFRCRPQYRVEEHVRRYDKLDRVLAAEREYPLQQFFLIPWLWQFFCQHRREVDRPRGWSASLYRLYWLVCLDVGFHLVLKSLINVFRSRGLIHQWFRRAVPCLVIRGWKVVDRSQDALTMEHELFRHIEIEVFVGRSQLQPALEFVRDVVRLFDGDLTAFDPATESRLAQAGLLEQAISGRGKYTHHYPICVRRVLADDTLISMASGDGEDYYALSFISYARPAERDGFFRFARFLAESMAELFDGRPHWGKVCPLSAAQIERLYPHIGTFRDLCSKVDSQGAFRNRWITEVLFPAESAVAPPVTDRSPGGGSTTA